MTDTAIATKKHPLIVLAERLDARLPELKAALPDDIEPRHFVRAVKTSAQLNPDILACSWPSLWNACLRACRDGLLPDGVEGALVPFKDKANWIPMFQGLLRRFRRSGQFRWVKAGLVHDGDKFEHHIDETGEHFLHVPRDDFGAPIIKVYACALTKDAGFFVEVMPMAEIEKIKKISRAQREDAPWNAWPEEMMKKTALRRLMKLLPNARDLMTTEDEPLEPSAPPINIIEEVEPLTQIPIGKSAMGGASSLDQFAATPGTAAPEPGAADARGGTVTESAAHIGPADDGGPAVVLIREAYERGCQARAAGALRKAMPGEYRDAAHSREALAWQAGWSGNPLPQWQDNVGD